MSDLGLACILSRKVYRKQGLQVQLQLHQTQHKISFFISISMPILVSHSGCSFSPHLLRHGNMLMHVTIRNEQRSEGWLQRNFDLPIKVQVVETEGVLTIRLIFNDFNGNKRVRH